MIKNKRFKKEFFLKNYWLGKGCASNQWINFITSADGTFAVKNTQGKDSSTAVFLPKKVLGIHFSLKKMKRNLYLRMPDTSVSTQDVKVNYKFAEQPRIQTEDWVINLRQSVKK